jgi:hypothetical protein
LNEPPRENNTGIKFVGLVDVWSKFNKNKKQAHDTMALKRFSNCVAAAVLTAVVVGDGRGASKCHDPDRQTNQTSCSGGHNVGLPFLHQKRTPFVFMFCSILDLDFCMLNVQCRECGAITCSANATGHFSLPGVRKPLARQYL